MTAGLPAGVHIVAVRHGRTNKLPDPQIRLGAGDGLLLFGEPGALDQARQQLGRLESGTVASDRSALDIGRFFVSRAALTGVPIGRLTLPGGVDAKIVEVRRGDASLIADPDLVLEYGDRVAVIASRQALPALATAFRRFDQIDDRGLVRVGRPGHVVRRAAGPRADSDSGPRPVLARSRRWSARGGAILGKLGRTGPLAWHMPLPANLTLRTFGLTLFLAAVGLGSGAPFVETLASAGVLFLAIAAAIVSGGDAGRFPGGQSVLRMATDDLLGVVSGITGNPAILVYANKVQPSDRIDAAFATIFPSLTILKILCAQVALGLLR